MSNRLPIILSSTALAVALFGATPLGEAAGDLAGKIVPRAKRADYAANAGAVNGIKASRAPRAGFLVPLGSDGKLPQSIVAGGVRAGGALSEFEEVFSQGPYNALDQKFLLVNCPQGKRLIGGAAQLTGAGATSASLYVLNPISQSKTWQIGAHEHVATSATWSIIGWAFCAKVS
jgi:hypothetical protein